MTSAAIASRWNMTTLGEVGRLVRGVNYDKSDAVDHPLEGHLPILRATNITPSGLDLGNNLVYVRQERVSENQRIRRGDILIAMSSGSKSVVGKAAQLHQDWPGSFGAFCAVLRIDSSKAYSPFIASVLQTDAYREHIQASARGTNINNLSRDHILSYTVSLPALAEQKAIMLALEAIRRSREARQRELELERERKAALMDHLFTYGTRGESTKQTEIGEIPKSWSVVRLGEIVHVRGGKRLPKGELFSEVPTEWPYIRVVDFADGSIRGSDLKHLTQKVQSSISRYTISKDDVYISIAGTIGLVGTVPEQLDGANLTENAAKLVIRDQSKIHKECVARFLQSQRGQVQIEGYTAKTTQPKLALARIQMIRVPVPPFSEQQEIAESLHACQNKLSAVEKESALLDELFQAMLEELMTGRLSAIPLVEGGYTHE